MKSMYNGNVDSFKYLFGTKVDIFFKLSFMVVKKTLPLWP